MTRIRAAATATCSWAAKARATNSPTLDGTLFFASEATDDEEAGTVAGALLAACAPRAGC